MNQNRPPIGNRAIRVLMQSRYNAYEQRGGDTVLMDRTAEGLRKLGVEVVIDLEAKEDPAKFDLVHLFNFALPKLLKILAERAQAAGTPYVVTTLCEDVVRFHNQSKEVAASVVEYIINGQDKNWWRENKVDISKVEKSQMFDNHWVAQNSAGLLTNGSEESRVVKAQYGENCSVMEVPLGYDIGTPGDPQLFINEFGIKDFVFCVGRFETRKNQLMLLKALEESDLDIVFAGGGFSYQPEYSEAVQRFQRKGRTFVVGRLSDEMLASAYAAAKVHVLPSWYELPGLVSLEAAYYGCNVVVTEYGTSRDYLGDKAFYCRPEDENSIYNAVMAAYHSPIQEGLKEVAVATSWEKTAMETFKAYQEILGAHADLSQEATISPEIAVSTEATVSPELTINPEVTTASSTVPSNHGGYDMAPLVTECQEVLEKGEAAAREKDFETAITCLEQALAINPNSTRTLVAIGAVYLAQSRTDEAIEYFSRGEVIEPNNPKILSGKGMCLMMRGEQEAAHTCFVKAVEQDPSDQVAILQLIEASYCIERFEELCGVLERFVQANPDNADMTFCYAGCLFRLGENDKAREQNNKVIQMHPLHEGAKELAEALSQPHNADSPINRETKIIETEQPLQQPVWTFWRRSTRFFN